MMAAPKIEMGAGGRRARPPGTWQGDTSLTDDEKSRICAMITEHGEYEAARMLRIARLTMVRAVGPLGIRHVTVAFVRERLVALAVKAG